MLEEEQKRVATHFALVGILEELHALGTTLVAISEHIVDDGALIETLGEHIIEVSDPDHDGYWFNRPLADD